MPMPWNVGFVSGSYVNMGFWRVSHTNSSIRKLLSENIWPIDLSTRYGNCVPSVASTNNSIEGVSGSFC